MKFHFENIRWFKAQNVESRSFMCFNCGNRVASATGYNAEEWGDFARQVRIYICPHCNAPTVFDKYNWQTSIQSVGEPIKKLPENVASVYEEVRSCLGVGAYTAATMMMRKLLMNFAVEKGEKPGKSFVDYVSFLCDNGYVHRSNWRLADKIRTLGNDSTHKITPISRDDCDMIFRFLVHFLKSNYEFSDEEVEDGE